MEIYSRVKKNRVMKQNDSKYHELYLMLQDADDYFPKEERSELLNLIKDLYNESNQSNIDCKGKYGIQYKTIGEDSRYPDTVVQFFKTKSLRDKVFDDWVNDRYWDKIMNQELIYPTPRPNFHNAVKVFKENKNTYIEK